MSDKKPSWIEKFTNTEEPLDIEAFSDLPKNYRVVEKQPSLVVAKRGYNSEKIGYALRLEKHINAELEACTGSKNSVINALLEFAIHELKRQNKTLLAE